MTLEDELKKLIINVLELEDITPDDIDTEVELGMALKKKYNLKMGTDKEQNQKHFYSVKTLADFIRSQQTN